MPAGGLAVWLDQGVQLVLTKTCSKNQHLLPVHCWPETEITSLAMHSDGS